MPVRPRASQVDKTRHGDTQKAAVVEKDSRMVGPGAGAERDGRRRRASGEELEQGA